MLFKKLSFFLCLFNGGDLRSFSCVCVCVCVDFVHVRMVIWATLENSDENVYGIPMLFSTHITKIYIMYC